MIQLIYFDFAGRGEAIRDALRWGRVPFNDVRVSFAEFQAMRASGRLPYDRLPILELEDGTILAQSNTILRWAAERAGLTPGSRTDALLVEALLDSAEEYGGQLSTSIRVTDEAVRAHLRSDLAARWLPQWFGLLEQRLGAAGHGWLVGNALTVADLKVVHLVDKLVNGTLSGIPTDLLSPFPALTAWRSKVHDARRGFTQC